MSACHNIRLCSPLKISARKNWGLVSVLLYHIQDTCYGYLPQRCSPCLLDRGLDILTEDTEHADIDNDSTHSSYATVTLGDTEAVGHA